MKNEYNQICEKTKDKPKKLFKVSWYRKRIIKEVKDKRLQILLKTECSKRFKFSFNVYNVFNYQPYYINSSLSYVYPNQAPTFGAELSLKL